MLLMSQAEYARHRGVGAPAVSNWKKAGLLAFAEDPAQPGKIKVDVVRSDAKINGRIDPMRGRPPTAAPPIEAAPGLPLDAAAPVAESVPSLSSIRGDLIREQLVGQQLKNAATAGELVPAIEAERRLSETARMLRERIQSEYRGLAERLAAEKDARTVMMLLEEAGDRVFEGLADDIAAGALDDDDEADETPAKSDGMKAAA